MKAVIFDLDGTLVDSISLWERVDRELLERHGCKSDDEYIKNITALSFSEGAKYIVEYFGIKNTPEEISDEIRELAGYEYENNLILRPDAAALIESLKKDGLKLSMVTSCIKEMCISTLKRNGVYDCFDFIFFDEEFGVNKSHPDIFLAAAEKMQVLPSDCLVFEDMPHAAEGAKAAGMKVIGVSNGLSGCEDDMRKICDAYIKEYSGISLEQLYGVFL